MIIPVYRESECIHATLASLRGMSAGENTEIIVVDGETEGSTAALVSGDGVKTILAPKGRARQMNAGAAKATGDVLLFLHADTQLPAKGFELIRQVMCDGGYVGGAFNFDIPKNRPLLRFNYYTSYLRSRLTRIAYGDQAIFIGRDYFNRLGGYRDIPLMEDVALMQAIKKRKDRIKILKEGVRTSTRRYDEGGLLKGWLRNNTIRLLYTLGASPHRLAKLYKTRGDDG